MVNTNKGKEQHMKPIPYNPETLTEQVMRSGVFVTDMPNEAYHAAPGISNSGLNLVARSPAHYRHRAEFRQTRAMEIGTAFHTALLEPDRFASEYMIVEGIDDRRKSEYKEAAKVYGKERALTASEGASVSVMAESIRANADAQEVLSQPGWAELSAFIEDPETGVLIRARFDWLTETGRAIDLKKTQDSREFSFSRSMYSYRYHCQAAMYSHVYELITGDALQRYQLLAVEEQPPCANVLYDIEPLAMQYGHAQYREALTEYAIAMQSGDWPAYGNSGVLTLPEYVLRDLEDEENG